MMEKHILDHLFEIVRLRKNDPVTKSYTAKLYAKGTPKIAQKVGEEAVETVIEAVAGNKEGLASESADLLYHLLVLWSDQDINPQDIWDELEERLGVSGLDEKKARNY